MHVGVEVLDTKSNFTHLSLESGRGSQGGLCEIGDGQGTDQFHDYKSVAYGEQGRFFWITNVLLMFYFCVLAIRRAA